MENILLADDESLNEINNNLRLIEKKDGLTFGERCVPSRRVCPDEPEVESGGPRERNRRDTSPSSVEKQDRGLRGA